MEFVRKCFKCEKSFINLVDLIFHIETTHLDFDCFEREFEGKPKPNHVHMSYVCRYFNEAQKDAYIQGRQEQGGKDVNNDEPQSSQIPLKTLLLPEVCPSSEYLSQPELLPSPKSAPSQKSLPLSKSVPLQESLPSPKSAQSLELLLSPKSYPESLPSPKSAQSLESLPSPKSYPESLKAPKTLSPQRSLPSPKAALSPDSPLPAKSASPLVSLMLPKSCTPTLTPLSEIILPSEPPFQSSFKKIYTSTLHIKTEPLTCSKSDDTSSFDGNDPVNVNIFTDSGFTTVTQQELIYKTLNKTFFCLFPGCEKHYTCLNGLKYHIRTIHHTEMISRKNILQKKETASHKQTHHKKEMVSYKETLHKEEMISRQNILHKKQTVSHKITLHKKEMVSYNKTLNKNKNRKRDRCTYECVCGQTYKYMKRMKTHCMLQHNSEDLSCVKIRNKPVKHKTIMTKKTRKLHASLEYKGQVKIVDHPYNYTLDSSLLESGPEDTCSLDFEEVQHHIADIITDEEFCYSNCMISVSSDPGIQVNVSNVDTIMKESSYLNSSSLSVSSNSTYKKMSATRATHLILSAMSAANKTALKPSLTT